MRSTHNHQPFITQSSGEDQDRQALQADNASKFDEKPAS
jgi:hypothetical protein